VVKFFEHETLVKDALEILETKEKAIQLVIQHGGDHKVLQVPSFYPLLLSIVFSIHDFDQWIVSYSRIPSP